MQDGGCGRCGAALETSGACAWCGAPPAPPPAPVVARTAPPIVIPAPAPRTLAARVAEFARAAEFAALADVRDAGVVVSRSPTWPNVVFGIVVAAGPWIMWSTRPRMRGPADPIAELLGADETEILPVVVVGVLSLAGIGIAARALWSGGTSATLPVRAIAAGVVTRRTALAGTEGVAELVGLEFADGSRGEFRSSDGAFALVRDGEVGVAILQRDWVVGFRVAPARFQQ